jgi:hypothetical protein
MLSAMENAKTVQWYIGHNSAFAPANRAVTPFRVNKPLRQIEFELHHAAVACSPVPRLNVNSAHLLDHSFPPYLSLARRFIS